jgi:hypothetical protein
MEERGEREWEMDERGRWEWEMGGWEIFNFILYR